MAPSVTDRMNDGVQLLIQRNGVPAEDWACMKCRRHVYFMIEDESPRICACCHGSLIHPDTANQLIAEEYRAAHPEC